MKMLLTLGGAVLLCASVVSGAGPLIVPTHPAWWFPSLSALAHVPPIEPLSEPARLLLMGVGFVTVARCVRRKTH